MLIKILLVGGCILFAPLRGAYELLILLIAHIQKFDLCNTKFEGGKCHGHAPTSVCIPELPGIGCTCADSIYEFRIIISVYLSGSMIWFF